MVNRIDECRLSIGKVNNRSPDEKNQEMTGASVRNGFLLLSRWRGTCMLNSSVLSRLVTPSLRCSLIFLQKMNEGEN